VDARSRRAGACSVASSRRRRAGSTPAAARAWPRAASASSRWSQARRATKRLAITTAFAATSPVASGLRPSLAPGMRGACAQQDEYRSSPTAQGIRPRTARQLFFRSLRDRLIRCRRAPGRVPNQDGGAGAPSSERPSPCPPASVSRGPRKEQPTANDQIRHRLSPVACRLFSPSRFAGRSGRGPPTRSSRRTLCGGGRRTGSR